MPSAPKDAPTADSWKTAAMESCRQKTRFEDLPQLLSKKDIHSSDQLISTIERNYICSALASGNPDRCNDAKGSSQILNRVIRHCKESYFDYNYVEASLRNDPSAEKLCAQILNNRPGGKQHCAVFTAIYRSRDINKCNSLHGKTVSKCKTHFLFFGGIKACQQIKDPFKRLWCENDALIEDAISSQNQSRCGKSYECHAILTKSPQSCTAAATDAVDMYCGIEVGADLQAQKSMEQDFRHDNGLPAYHAGDPFLHLLPPDEREPYQKARKQRALKKGLPHKSPPDKE